MRSLTVKLIAAFAIVCCVEALLVVILLREATQREFSEYVRVEAIEVFKEDVTEYYEMTGSLEGVEAHISQTRQPPKRPPPRGGRPPGFEQNRPAGVPAGPPPRPGTQRSGPPRSPRFGLANPSGQVLMQGDGIYHIGDVLTEEDIEQGEPLYIGGRLVGTVLLPAGHIPLSEREVQFLSRLDTVIIVATLSVLGISIFLGIWVANGYLGPLKELTAASKALASGDLGTQVAIRSRDEIGALTASFNQMSAQLQDISEQRRRMTADIAHDLRTPLTVLKGYLEALMHGELKPSPERFQTMHQEAAYLSHLVDDLRTLALVDAGQLSLNKQPVPVERMLASIHKSFEQQAQEKGVALSVTNEAEGSEVNVDPERLRQILTNLVSNAIRHTASGGAVQLRGRWEGREVVLDVIDTGEGIPEDALGNLFDRFYRVDAARQRTKGESGLGLSIVKSLVEAHGGTIEVESAPGKGSCFTIRLPHP